MEQHQTLPDVLRRHAAERPDHTAIVCPDESPAQARLSYGELDRRASQVAQGLLALELGSEPRVAVLAKDSLHTYELIFGIAKAGAVYLGINWRLAAPEIAFVLEDAEAPVLFVDRTLVGRVATLRSELPNLRHVIVVGAPELDVSGYAGWRASQPAVDPMLAVAPHAAVAQMYTSGTTGRPKGVMLAHRSFFAVVQAMRDEGNEWIGWSPADVSLICFPSFHIGGLWWAMTGFEAGATNVVLETFIGWKALDAIQGQRVSKACMVAAMMQMILSEPDAEKADFSSLTHVVYGGSPIPLPLLERGLETFGCGFGQIYGLTETGNTAVFLWPEDHADRGSARLRAAGRPYPTVRVRVLDPEGRELPPRSVGEICIHSPANMLGYWKRPEATAETLRAGWVHTGDAGYMDEDGYVYVSDRIKDMIIAAGENIYPAEIESVLSGHSAVAEAAVIGVPDDRWGEQVKAIVALVPGKIAKAGEIIAHCRGKVADFKVPRSVDFVDALPRTPSGKIQKHLLREPFWKDRDRGVN